MKFGFAGDREIALKILSSLKSLGHNPSVLLIGDSKSTTHAQSLIEICDLNEKMIIRASDLNKEATFELLKSLNLDYIFGIHFPYIISSEILNIPSVGFLNLHPAYLPFNKGWHTPSWAIIDGTPYGATLHFMSEKLDEGDIIHQKEIIVEPHDTADSLYQRVLNLEYNVFMESLPELVSLIPQRKKQDKTGTSHNKKDLSKIAEIDLNQSYQAKELIKLLRGLTTNNISESAYYIIDGKKYNIQVQIKEQ